MTGVVDCWARFRVELVIQGVTTLSVVVKLARLKVWLVGLELELTATMA